MKVRTSVLRGFALLALSSLTFAACDDKSTDPLPPAVSVTVTPPTVNLQVGQTTNLVAVVANAANQNVTWTSANQAVATVDANGQVTAVSAGTAVITAASVQDPNARAAAAVVVTAPPQTPVTLQLVPPTASVQVGGTVQLVSVVGGTANQAVTYESATPGVATVNATTGLVTGVAPGTAVITARTAAGTPQAVATSVITVTSTPPGEIPTVTITPTQATTQVGGSQQFVATVSGAQNQAVIWRSESENIATINQQGLATAVAPGTAVITAMAAADTMRRVQATLTVTATPPVTQPAISMATVQSPVGNPIAPGATIGTAVVPGGNDLRTVVNVSAGSEALIQRVEIQLNGVVGCTQTFAPPLAATQGVQTIECVVNTARVDTVSNTPVFMNGNYQVTAVAFNQAGEVVATANWGSITLNNAPVFAWTITTEGVTSGGSTIGADNLLWREGDVVVAGSPVLFGGGTVSQMTICLDLPGASNATPVLGTPDAVPATANPCRVVTMSENNRFSATFPKANTTTQTTGGGNGVANVSNSNVRPYASAGVLAEGSAFPGQTPGMIPAGTPSIRLDNLAPTATITPQVAPVWFGANTVFGSSLPGATANPITTLVEDPYPGVGLPGAAERVTYHAVTREAYLASGTTAAARIAATAATPAITNVNDLPENVSAVEYSLVISIVDRLGNRRNAFVTDFGVDRTAPTVDVDELASEDNQTAFTAGPQTVITLDMVDDFSGFPAEPVLVRIDRRFFDADGNLIYQCLRQGGNWTANTGTAATACTFVTRSDSDIVLPNHEAHYIVQTRVRDRAGNMTPIITREYVIDGTDPDAEVTGLSWSATNVTLTGAFSDNVDLAWYDARAQYSGNVIGLPSWLPLTTPTEISSFGLPLVGETTVTRTLPFIRGFAEYDVLGAPSGNTYDLTAVGFRATDHSGNWDEDLMGFARSFEGLPTTLQLFGMTVVPSPSNAAINELCIEENNDCAAGIATSLQFRAVAQTLVTANTSPFSRVYFYAEFDGDAYLLGIDETAVLQTFGIATDPFPAARREWRYDITLSGAQAVAVMQGITDGDAFQIFAIGVDAQGDGAIAAPAQVTARD